MDLTDAEKLISECLQREEALQKKLQEWNKYGEYIKPHLTKLKQLQNENTELQNENTQLRQWIDHHQQTSGREILNLKKQIETLQGFIKSTETLPSSNQTQVESILESTRKEIEREKREKEEQQELENRFQRLKLSMMFPSPPKGGKKYKSKKNIKVKKKTVKE